jgi:exonuclease VII small subunit
MTTKSSDMARKKTIPYDEAITEIEGILARFRSEEMNVDELAAQVRRASELIALCKERLHKAETEVGQILGAE